MSVKKIILIIWKVLKIVVSIHLAYKKLMIKKAAKLPTKSDDKFIILCEKNKTHAKKELKIKVISSEYIGDFYYLKGTYPDGSPYKLKMQRGK